MATATRQTLRLFSTTSRSMGTKINIQKPRMPWIERRILNAVTKPLFPPDRRPLPQKCLDEQKAKDIARRSELQEAYDAFRTKDTYQMLSENKMVAICHVLPMTSRDFFNVRVKVHNAGMKLKFANNKWAKAAIQNNRLQNLEPFFTSDNIFILCEEMKLAQLMLLLKKTPELQLLGGLVEDRIMSRAGMQDAAKLPPLDIMRGELLTILSASANKTSRLLGRHQADLSVNLAQLVKQEGPDRGGSDAGEGFDVTEQSTDSAGEKEGS